MDYHIIVVGSGDEGCEILAGFGSMVVVEFECYWALCVWSASLGRIMKSLHTIVVSRTTSVAITAMELCMYEQDRILILCRKI